MYKAQECSRRWGALLDAQISVGVCREAEGIERASRVPEDEESSFETHQIVEC